MLLKIECYDRDIRQIKAAVREKSRPGRLDMFKRVHNATFRQEQKYAEDDEEKN
jgi:hypothetical protein